MMVSASTVLIRGYLGTDPKRFEMRGADACSFRLASTRTYFDRHTQQWRESATIWITVRVFRTLARNVLQSLVKGDPVFVVGELSSDDWVTEDGHPRTSIVLDAQFVGHDLNIGISTFRRAHLSHSQQQQQQQQQGWQQGGQSQWQSSQQELSLQHEQTSAQEQHPSVSAFGSGEVRQDGEDDEGNDEFSSGFDAIDERKGVQPVEKLGALSND